MKKLQENNSNNNNNNKRQVTITNLVFEGGGVKGFAYLGALEKLIESGLELTAIKSVGGTSAGAITALLLGLNYSLDEIKDLFNNMEFTEFLDGNDEVKNLLIKNNFRLPSKYTFFKEGLKFIYFKTKIGLPPAIIFPFIQIFLYYLYKNAQNPPVAPGGFFGYVKSLVEGLLSYFNFLPKRIVDSLREKMKHAFFTTFVISLFLYPLLTIYMVWSLQKFVYNTKTLGLFNGEKLEEWIKNCIEKQTGNKNATF